MEAGTKLEYVFSYGFNNPEHIADLLSMPVDDLLPYWVPWTLHGHRRGFAGEDKVFDHSSVATIVKDPTSWIKSYAFAIEETDISYVDEFEVVPEEYERRQVQVEDKNGWIFDAYVYVMTERHIFKKPTEEYLKGVALTHAAHYYLNDEDRDYEHFEVELFDALTGKSHGFHQVTLSMSDYPNTVRQRIHDIKSRI